MRSAKSYIKETGDFVNKHKELGSVPQNALLVTVDVVKLYPSIPHQDGLDALSIKLEQREDKEVPTEDLLKMAQFFLKNNDFEFSSKVNQHVSGTVIATKFTPLYACIFMDRMETEFLEKERLKPWVWLRDFDDILFVLTLGKINLMNFLNAKTVSTLTLNLHRDALSKK